MDQTLKEAPRHEGRGFPERKTSINPAVKGGFKGNEPVTPALVTPSFLEIPNALQITNRMYKEKNKPELKIFFLTYQIKKNMDNIISCKSIFLRKKPVWAFQAQDANKSIIP
jgi:hypothetical protein